MTCGQIQAQLAAYHEGGLRPSQRRAVGVHLTGCPECRAELASFDQGDRALRRFSAATPDTVMYSDVLRRVAAEETARRRRTKHLRMLLSRTFHLTCSLCAAGIAGSVLVVLVQGLHQPTGTGVAAPHLSGGIAPATVGSHPTLSTSASRGDMGQTTAATPRLLDLRREGQSLGAPLLPNEGRLVYLILSAPAAALAGSAGTLIVEVPLSSTTARATTLVPPPGIYSTPSVSPDGRWLAYGVHTDGISSKNRGIWIRDAAITSKGYRILLPHDSPDLWIEDLRWSRDGRHLIYAVQDRATVMDYVADVRAVLALLANHPIPLHEKSVYPPDAGGVAPIVRSFQGWAPSVNQALSPDLTLLATAGEPAGTRGDQPIVVRDLRSGRRWTVGVGAHPVWAPDGASLAFLARPAPADGFAPGHVATLWVVSARGGVPHPLLSTPRPIDGLSWSPDGRAIAVAVRASVSAPSSNSDLVIVDTARPRSTRLIHAGCRVGDLVWSPAIARAR
jgi:anti-sigma factor RsiW